jgi:hypothetical protein
MKRVVKLNNEKLKELLSESVTTDLRQFSVNDVVDLLVEKEIVKPSAATSYIVDKMSLKESKMPKQEIFYRIGNILNINSDSVKAFYYQYLRRVK